MVECKPAIKEYNLNPKTNRNWVRNITRHPCFRCIRNVAATSKYDFAYECAADVMIKMDNDELEILSHEVLQVVLDINIYETRSEELILLGDCLARVFMHTTTRGNYLREMFLEYVNVRDVIRIAADRSMPAYGVASLYDKDITFPLCWLELGIS